MEKVEIVDTFKEYLSQGDWRVKENSNSIYCFGGLIKYVLGKTTALYWESMYNDVDTKIIEGHRNGDFHIHDLGSYSSYCFGASLNDLLLKGIRGITNVSVSSPAKRLQSVCAQIANIVTIFQNEIAGAVAFSSWNTYLAPFIYFDVLKSRGLPINFSKKIDLDYTDDELDSVKQIIEGMIFQLNSNSRMGSEPAFSNLTLDFKILTPMLDKAIIFGGECKDLTYKEFQKEADILLDIFTNVMMKGDSDGKPFAYPIPTFNIGKNMEWDKHDSVFELAAKTGAPYFGNFMHGVLDESDVYSMCPLSPSTKILTKSEKGINVQRIDTIVRNLEKGQTIQVRGTKDWYNAKPVRMPLTKVLRVKLSNGSSVEMGINHLQPTQRGTLKAGDLVIGDKIPYNKEVSDLYCEDDSFIYYTIVDIEEVKDVNYKELFCFEVESDEHIFMLADGMFTHNCRLRLDKRELMNKVGGLFGAAEKTGSLGVFTINLPAIGYRNNSREDFFEDLDEKLEIGYKQLLTKKRIIQKEFEAGLYPALKEYLGSLRTLFLTIGFVGAHEMCLNFLKKGIETTEGRDFTIEVIHFMRNKLSEFQERCDSLFNLEYTPAESAAYRLALKDVKRYPDIITSGASEPYYTNSTHLPVGLNWSFKQIYEHQNGLLSLATGGSVYHNYLEGSTTKEAVKHFLKVSFSNYDLPYISFSPVYSICEVHGFISGGHDKCPTCGGKVTVYQRITGYVRPIENFNKGKLEEFKERVQRKI